MTNADARNDPETVLAALRASAGAWSADAHPELQTREDVVSFVQTLRAGFGRQRMVPGASKPQSR